MQRLIPARLLAALRSDPGTPLDLPSDIAREARRRVRVGALLGASAYVLFLLVEVSGLSGGTGQERSIDLAHDIVALGLCLMLYVSTALRAIADRQVLSTALIVEVLLSCVISVAIPWASYIRTGHLAGLTWVVPIIILFPLLVPAPPRIAFVVSVLCALTMPAGLWVLRARGAIEAHPSDFVAAFVTGAVAVGIASVASRTVYGAHRQIAAARQIGSYELLERLGRGGMGEVWKARHLLLARPAAVKLILPERLLGATEKRDEVVKRFTREAQVTASLRSPHTVELFDFGSTPDGTFYYAMELLDGINLEHFIYRFGAIEPRRAVNWLQQMCHSLGEAHSRDLVHRDIKPGNLYLCRYGRDCDFVKVLDFGLTKPLDATEADPSLTRPGARLGTPSYMAPEQVFGLSTDPRTDLYALGCVGYWLLAGEKPFEANTAGELMRQHAQVAPPPLSRTDHPVPERLEAVIMACLSKDPGERPITADQLSEQLATALEGVRWSDSEARDWWVKNLNEV